MALDKNGKQLPRGVSYKADKGLYMARFMFEGQQHTSYHKDVKSAQKWLRDARYEAEHGLAGRADKLSLDSWYAVWMEQYKIPSIKETSALNYAQMYTHYIQPVLGKMHLSKIRPLHIKQIYNDLLERGLAPKSISNIQGMFYDLMEIAVKNDLIIKNPCAGVTIPKAEKTERRVLTIAEQAKVMEYLKHDEWKYLEPLVTVMLGTGLRIGEILGLTWSDIDFEENQITVNKTLVYPKSMKDGKHRFKYQTPKTRDSARTIPMLADVATALRHQWRNQSRLRLFVGAEWEPLEGFEHLVFPNFNGRPYQNGEIRGFFFKLVKEINADEQALAAREGREPVLMEHFSPHSLRHSFATRCFEADLPPKTVQAFLGHASVQLTMDLYTHVAEDKKKADMQKLEVLYKTIN